MRLLSFCSASGREEQRFNSVKHSLLHRYYVASLILHASIAEITAQLLSLSYVYLISSDDGAIIRIFVQINILEGRAGYVLMDRVSVTISYSSRCLTTEIVKYTNENSFIENLASSKYSMWHREAHLFVLHLLVLQTNVIINVHFAFSKEELPCVQKCKQVCVSKLLSAKKEK